MTRYIKGDLFSHKGKGKVILAHACNPFGSWGGGIAAQFRQRYPYANKLYAEHCQKNNDIIGSCLLIPSSECDTLDEANLLIACLFTSDFICSDVDILKYTRSSISSLSNQVQGIKGMEIDSNNLPVINMPQINRGIFNVPWENTEAILKENKQLSFIVYTL